MTRKEECHPSIRINLSAPFEMTGKEECHPSIVLTSAPFKMTREENGSIDSKSLGVPF
jgi:hypothetical protein